MDILKAIAVELLEKETIQLEDMDRIIADLRPDWPRPEPKEAKEASSEKNQAQENTAEPEEHSGQDTAEEATSGGPELRAAPEDAAQQSESQENDDKATPESRQ